VEERGAKGPGSNPGQELLFFLFPFFPFPFGNSVLKCRITESSVSSLSDVPNYYGVLDVMGSSGVGGTAVSLEITLFHWRCTAGY
jgi:hypothetical protein